MVYFVANISSPLRASLFQDTNNRRQIEDARLLSRSQIVLKHSGNLRRLCDRHLCLWSGLRKPFRPPRLVAYSYSSNVVTFCIHNCMCLCVRTTPFAGSFLIPSAKEWKEVYYWHQCIPKTFM